MLKKILICILFMCSLCGAAVEKTDLAFISELVEAINRISLTKKFSLTSFGTCSGELDLSRIIFTAKDSNGSVEEYSLPAFFAYLIAVVEGDSARELVLERFNFLPLDRMDINQIAWSAKLPVGSKKECSLPAFLICLIAGASDDYIRDSLLKCFKQIPLDKIGLHKVAFKSDFVADCQEESSFLAILIHQICKSGDYKGREKLLDVLGALLFDSIDLYKATYITRYVGGGKQELSLFAYLIYQVTENSSNINFLRDFWERFLSGKIDPYKTVLTIKDSWGQVQEYSWFAFLIRLISGTHCCDEGNLLLDVLNRFLLDKIDLYKTILFIKGPGHVEEYSFLAFLIRQILEAGCDNGKNLLLDVFRQFSLDTIDLHKIVFRDFGREFSLSAFLISQMIADGDGRDYLLEIFKNLPLDSTDLYKIVFRGNFMAEGKIEEYSLPAFVIYRILDANCDGDRDLLLDVFKQLPLDDIDMHKKNLIVKHAGGMVEEHSLLSFLIYGIGASDKGREFLLDIFNQFSLDVIDLHKPILSIKYLGGNMLEYSFLSFLLFQIAEASDGRDSLLEILRKIPLDRIDFHDTVFEKKYAGERVEKFSLLAFLVFRILEASCYEKRRVSLDIFKQLLPGSIDLYKAFCVVNLVARFEEEYSLPAFFLEQVAQAHDNETRELLLEAFEQLSLNESISLNESAFTIRHDNGFEDKLSLKKVIAKIMSQLDEKIKDRLQSRFDYLYEKDEDSSDFAKEERMSTNLFSKISDFFSSLAQGIA